MNSKGFVYSFDVFDTALTRIWATPTDLFWELGRQLENLGILSISVKEWVSLRISVEKELRKEFENNEVNFFEIYDRLSDILEWSEIELVKAQEAELELERVSLKPVPAIKREIEMLHNLGQEVYYLSDMYLPSHLIQECLDVHGLWNSQDKLYISSEHRKNKVFGDLFKIFLEDVSCPPNQVIHKGDNYHSDVKVPQQLGINTALYEETQLNRYEALLLDRSSNGSRFDSLLGGISRLTRLQNHLVYNSSHKIIWDTTSSVIAPLLFGFVLWVLLQAQHLGLKRLYFLARDGQVLLKVAQVITRKWNIPIECKYLYASRQAWHFPTIVKLDSNALDWIFDKTDFLSIRSALSRINVAPEEIENHLKSSGFSPEKWNVNLSHSERENLKQIILRRDIEALIANRAKDYRKQAINYLHQEGITDGMPSALVDIGWNGRLQRSLSLLLSAEGLYPKTGSIGFYFGLINRYKAFSQDKLFAYFSDYESPSPRDSLCHLALIELFVSATHGSTVSFDLGHQGYKPVLRSETNESALDWGLPILQKAVEEFAIQFTGVLELESTSPADLLRTSELLLREFVTNPSQDEASVFGSFLFAEDQAESVFYELAPVYTKLDSLRLLLHGKHQHQNVWQQASLKRSSSLSRLIIRASRITSKLHRFIS